MPTGTPISTLASVAKPTREIVSQRRLPIAEVGDEDEGDDDENGEPPGSMQPIGERREGEDDDEKRDVQEDRGEAVDQKVDDRRHRVEESGCVVLQPGDADLDPAPERYLGLGEPTLQRSSSRCGPDAPARRLPVHAARGGEGDRRGSARLEAEARLDRREPRLAVERRHALKPVRRVAAGWSSATPAPPLVPHRHR